MRLTYIRLLWSTRSPLSVSAPELGSDAFDQEAASEIDLPIRRDPFNRPSIPGTSVAGAVRAALPAEHREQVMGAASRPSPLSILGVEVAADAAIEASRHTAIDRRRGAARTSTLHSRESIAAGTPIVVRMLLESEGDAPVEVLLRTLRAWRPRLGSGASVGRGLIDVSAMQHRTLDLSRDDDLAEHLGAAGPAGFDRVVGRGSRLEGPDTISDPVLSVSFEIADALHIGSGDDKPAGAAIPVKRNSAGPLVPGSTLKGVVRSRCEYLIRSLGGRACEDGRCGDCPACRLFGFGGGPRTDRSSVGQRAAVAFRNAQISDAQVSERTHVSVDRFTGGALEGGLFVDEVVTSGRFEVAVDPLHGELPAWGAGIILSALIDLDDGLIGLGASTTRGYGSVRAEGGRLATRPWDGGGAAMEVAGAALREAVTAYPAATDDTEGTA